MSFEVTFTARLRKESECLVKKYHSLKEETLKIIQLLKEKPPLGIEIGNNIYKIRVGVRSKVAGRSGGGGVTTYVVDQSGDIYLLPIYDKSENPLFQTKR